MQEVTFMRQIVEACGDIIPVEGSPARSEPTQLSPSSSPQLKPTPRTPLPSLLSSNLL